MQTISKSLSLNRAVKAAGYAGAGVWFAFRNEPSFLRAALVEIVLAVGLGWYLYPMASREIAVLLMAGALVLITEILNTSIEILVDMVEPKQDVRVKRIKDCAAGATFLASCSGLVVCALVVWAH